MSETTLERAFRKQEGRCHWCQQAMLEPGVHRPEKGKAAPHNLCTRDHLRDALAHHLREAAGHHEFVAACHRCNTSRGVVRGQLIPIANVRLRGKRTCRPARMSRMDEPA